MVETLPLNTRERAFRDAIVHGFAVMRSGSNDVTLVSFLNCLLRHVRDFQGMQMEQMEQMQGDDNWHEGGALYEQSLRNMYTSASEAFLVDVAVLHGVFFFRAEHTDSAGVHANGNFVTEVGIRHLARTNVFAHDIGAVASARLRAIVDSIPEM